MATKRKRPPTPIAALLPAVTGQPWAIDLPVLRSIAQLTRPTASFDPLDLRAAFGYGSPGAAAGSGPVRIIPVYGPITNHASVWSEYFGGASVDGMRRDLKAALEDATVKAVVFTFASPGGEVMGMTEFAKELRAVRGGAKPIVAMIDSYAHSAAYWLAAQCDEVVLTPSGTAGSIGVYCVHEEYSEALEKAGITETVIGSTVEKTEGLDVIPLTDEAEQAIRDIILAHASMFTSDVAAGRNVSVDAVNKTFGQGRVLMAKQALEVGMVDRIDTIGNTLLRLSRSGRSAGARAEDEGPEIIAETGAEEQPEPVPFTDRLAHLAATADELVVHAQERGRLRAKEGRPPISNKNLAALRATREAIGTLLALGDAEIAETVEAPAVEPPVAKTPVTAPPAPAARAPRPVLSDDAWAQFLERELAL